MNSTSLVGRIVTTVVATASLAVPGILILILGTGSFTHQLPDTTAVLTSATTTGTRMAPCVEEDGSGQFACVWDGQSAGNGVGRSFIALHGGTDRARYVYVSHRTAHRLIVGA